VSRNVAIIFVSVGAGCLLEIEQERSRGRGGGGGGRGGPPPPPDWTSIGYSILFPTKCLFLRYVYPQAIMLLRAFIILAEGGAYNGQLTFKSLCLLDPASFQADYHSRSALIPYRSTLCDRLTVPSLFNFVSFPGAALQCSSS